MLKSCKLGTVILLVVFYISLFITGCKENYENNKVKLAYYGINTELPLITAFEKGYFKEEGLDVELVKVKPEDFVNDINNKIVDGGTCDYKILKSIEDGAKIKVGAGLQSRAIEILTKAESGIDTIEGLKNKKIGIEDRGGGSMLAAKNLFDKYNIDFSKDITWTYLSKDKLKDSLKSGSVDGIILYGDKENNSEFKTLFKGDGMDMSSMIGHSHHGNEYIYIAFAGISKELSDNDPEKAAAILRAWIKGANKIEENSDECIKNSIDDGYINGSYEENSQEIKQYMWMPSVKVAEDNLKAYIKIQKSLGILSDGLNEDSFYKNSFAEVLPYWS
ncbi:ABC transporter substrate-binding protein [Clostridium sp. YIM B02555]|uniref:ABC transporter substrate-binding protein n=1 Tax=Clostridium sp. YIM B02555 TaxID=2911968 RepID=UPI001EEE4AAC|nr:ABC transporter substrate-binding protein [Clostridium sp. YIM B02555]